MTMTETIIPHIDTPIAQLFEQPELFQTVDQATAWVDQYGDQALTQQVAEIIRNLLGASASDRQQRGLQLLERQIRAQAAWTQLFELMAPCGAFEQLKRLVGAMRDEDLDAESYEAAKQAVLIARVEYSERKREAESSIAVIIDLADEEAFIFSARDGLKDWQVATLDAVLQGKGLRQHPNSLRVTAERLSFLSRRFFGEMPTGNGGGKSKGRSAHKAAKSARDKEIRRKMQQPKGSKPQLHGKA